MFLQMPVQLPCRSEVFDLLQNARQFQIKMAQFEIDCFYRKFKNLLHSEKDATFTIKSEARRAFVTLSLDLGHVLAPPLQRPRNGPSRQRCRARREEARRVAAEVAEAH